MIVLLVWLYIGNLASCSEPSSTSSAPTRVAGAMTPPSRSTSTAASIVPRRRRGLLLPPRGDRLRRLRRGAGLLPRPPAGAQPGPGRTSCAPPIRTQRSPTCGQPPPTGGRRAQRYHPGQAGDVTKIFLVKRQIRRLLLSGGHLLVPRPDGLRHHGRGPGPALRDHPGPAARGAEAARPAGLRDRLLGREPAACC